MDMLEELLQTCVIIGKQQSPVNISINFKGYSNTVNGIITKVFVNKREVHISSMNEKVLPFFPYSNVILRSDALPYPLKARVKEIDFSKKSAMLDHLEYIYEDLGSRSEVRVEPQEDLHITITDDQLHVLPCLAIDLSTNGLSVLVEKKDISHLHDHLPDDKTLRVTFSLPEMDDLDEQQVSFLARMVYELEADNGFRVGLKIYPTSMDLIKLQRYIHALHTDTIQNIMKKES